MCCTMLLLPSKFEVACTSYSEWSKKKKKEAEDEEKYKENRKNFEGTYLSNGWADSPQI